VESLLEEHQRKSPLDSSTPGELASLVSQDSINNLEEPDSKIGRYTIVKHIGDGGMGSVYEAQQENPNRAIAIKVIKRGMNSKQVIARVEAERQSVAMMDHPSIARVFDAGTTDDGRPYFAMELVHDVSIIEYCDTNTLQTEQRLTLFTQVCRAIQHAHQKGVIHRDIKPSNVLVTEVDGVAIPKVIDFGNAKATSTDLESNTAFTLQGQLVGTPAYMSPEQAEMSGPDVDTRSVIYALGVLLYELLTGTTPFTEQELHHMGFVEMMRVICNDEPPRPSTRLSSLGESAIQTAELRGVDSKSLVSSLSGDLDWIVMMCLEKDRVKRYSTAFELSEDIRRFLHNEPVIARPHNTRYMLSKFVKRNRGRVVAGCVVASVLVLGVIGTTTGMIWALDERSNAEQNADKAISEALTGKSIIEYLLTDLLGAADPARLEDRDLTVREAVFIASESIEGKFADRPKIEARIRSTIARTLEQLGVFDEAEPHHRRQLELYESLEGQSGVLSIHARHALASNLMHQSRFDDAINITLEEINILRASRESRDEQLVNALSNLGVAYLQTGQYNDAAPILEESLVTKRVTQGDLDVSTLSSIHNLAGLYGQIGQHERSLELAKEAYEGRLEVLGPGDPRTFGSMNLVTWMLNALEEFDESKTIQTLGTTC